MGSGSILRLCFGLAKYQVWIIVRGSFLLLQSIVWRITGTSATLKKNYRTDSYHNTIHVLNIHKRYKFDVILQPSGVHNFISSHQSFEDPEYVLKDNVSLYYLKRNEAIFVEVDNGLDVTNSENGAFYRVAQFELAKKLIVVPMHIFHKLGERVGRPNGKVIFLCNTARCGSTLLTQVFEKTETCVALSEPDAVNALTNFYEATSGEELDNTIIHKISLLCKPTSGQKHDAYLLKICSPSISLLPYFNKLFPGCFNLFAYRNGLAVSQSLAKASEYIPLLGWIYLLGKISPRFTVMLIRATGQPSAKFNWLILSPIQYGAILWCSAVRQYLDLWKKGLDIVGIRYQDVVTDTKYTFEAIFSHCGLPYNADAVQKAFSQDSQKVSPISREKLARIPLMEFTTEIKKQTDNVCDYFQLPHYEKDYIAPGTITFREK